jgi:hypothetical protein
MSFLNAASSVLGGGRDTNPLISGAGTGPVSVGLGGDFRGSSKDNPWVVPVVVLGGAAILAFYLLKK